MRGNYTMDIKSFRNRVYKNSKILNSLIVSSILVPGIVTIIILLFLDTKYDGLLISMLLILSLFLLAMIYKIFYNLFLFKINEDDAKISIKTDVVGIKFKLYDELYGKYGSKTFGLIIKIKSNKQTLKILYPFIEDIRFGVKREAWNQKYKVLNKLNQIKEIDVVYLEKSKVIINKIDLIDKIIKKI